MGCSFNINDGKKFFSLSQKGFSLAETMVAIGIAGIVSLAVANVVESAMRSTRYINARTDIDQVQKLLDLAFRNPTLCGANFVSKDPLPPVAFDKVALEDAASAATYKKDVTNYLPLTPVGGIGQALIPAATNRIGLAGLQVIGAQFTNPRKIGTNAYLMDYVVRFDARGTLGSNEMTSSVPVKVFTNATGDISGCETNPSRNDLTQPYYCDGSGTPPKAPVNDKFECVWDVAVGVEKIKFEVWGAGGGAGLGQSLTTSGGVSTTPYVTYGAGGGGGAYFFGKLEGLTAGTRIYITVGGGGGHGIAGAVGSNGKASCFNLVGPDPTCAAALVRAPGGYGGGYAGSAAQYSQGGGGGLRWSGTAYAVIPAADAQLATYWGTAGADPLMYPNLTPGVTSLAFTSGVRNYSTRAYGNNGDGGKAGGAAGGVGGSRQANPAWGPSPTGNPQNAGGATSNPGQFPGGGGGATVIKDATQHKGDGAPGRVIIWF